MKVKNLIKELKKLNPDDTITLYESETDQLYRFFGSPIKEGGGHYIMEIKKTQKVD